MPDSESERPTTAITQLLIAWSDGEREALVLDVAGEDRPGSLAMIAGKASDAGVNLTACYAATRSRIVLVSDDAAALRKAVGG